MSKRQRPSRKKLAAKLLKLEPREIPDLWEGAYKPGAYRVDAYADVLFPKSRSLQKSKGVNETDIAAIEATRREVTRAARIAVAHEHHERIRWPRARDKAVRLLALRAHVESEAVKLFPVDEGNDDAADAADIAEGFAKPDQAVQPLVAIIEDITSLRLSNVRRVAIAAAPPKHSDPLARYFLDAMAAAYNAWRKKDPPSGRTGPYVNLLEAAWLDLGFPRPTTKDRFGRGPKDLNEWLGLKVQERAKRLQGLPPKRPGQTL